MNNSPYVRKESKTVSYLNKRITVAISAELTWGENFTSYGVSNRCSFSEATDRAFRSASNKLRLAIRRRDHFRHRIERQVPRMSTRYTTQKKEPKLALDMTLGELIKKEIPQKLPRWEREKLEHKKLDLELHGYFGRNKEEAEREEHRILDQELEEYTNQRETFFSGFIDSCWSSEDDSWDRYVEDWDY